MVSGASFVQSVLSLARFTLHHTGSNLTELFGPSLSSAAQIILPNETQWTAQVRQRWSVFHAPTYLGAIKPSTETDVEHIIQIASAHDIPFLTTGGGHGISDYSRFKGIAVDLGNFKSVHLDADQNRLTVGGAVEYSQLHQLLYDAGKELPLASCPCIGVLGATMGAGIGPLVGRHGLLLDALESVRIVTGPESKAITASKVENADLFWAIRGAGANFGIVTSATYKVYEMTNDGQATVADLVFPAAANHSFFEALRSFDQDMPSALGMTAGMMYNREANQALVVVHAVYFGPEDEGLRHLEPFRRLGALLENVRTMPQTKLFPADHGACVPNQRINLHTAALRRIDPPALAAIFARLARLWERWPDYNGRVIIQRFDGRVVGAVPDASTAYPWREAVAHLNVENFYADPGHDEAVSEFSRWARGTLAASSGFEQGLATYVNYAHGDEGPEAWYSARKLARLAGLKRKWDPRGLFSWSNPVPSSWSEEEL